MSRRLKRARRMLERKRKKIDYTVRQKKVNTPLYTEYMEEEREAPHYYVPSHLNKEPNPLPRYFLLRTVVAAFLFLMLFLLYESNTTSFSNVKQFVEQSFQEEFQFAVIANWYETQFGRPLALVPLEEHEVKEGLEGQVEMAYALPATGVIRENFAQNGKGVLIETGMGTEIEAVRGGYVILVGEKSEENMGKMVVVQHYDETESIYGLLDDIHVNMYDHIQAGDSIGTVSLNEQINKGVFYFALKKGDNYFDPSEVLPLE